MKFSLGMPIAVLTRYNLEANHYCSVRLVSGPANVSGVTLTNFTSHPSAILLSTFQIFFRGISQNARTCRSKWLLCFLLAALDELGGGLSRTVSSHLLQQA